jgi:hypothetical protein
MLLLKTEKLHERVSRLKPALVGASEFLEWTADTTLKRYWPCRTAIRRTLESLRPGGLLCIAGVAVGCPGYRGFPSHEILFLIRALRIGGALRGITGTPPVPAYFNEDGSDSFFGDAFCNVAIRR